jgi:hypothetical protein
LTFSINLIHNATRFCTMAHQIVVDQEKGIIKLIHRDVILHHELWGTSHEMLGKLSGKMQPRILADMRGARLMVDQWEKKEFAQAHHGLFQAGTRIAMLIAGDEPLKKEFLLFERMFSKSGVEIKVFENEFEAEEWLTSANQI